MNKDEIKGKSKDIAGRVQRQVGEWTGNEEAQVEGAAKQVEGKIQKTWGAVKEKSKEVAEELDRPTEDIDKIDKIDEKARGAA